MVSNIFSTCSFLFKLESLYGVTFLSNVIAAVKLHIFWNMYICFNQNRFVISKELVLFNFNTFVVLIIILL